jgi:hypothetical protein
MVQISPLLASWATNYMSRGTTFRFNSGRTGFPYLTGEASLWTDGPGRWQRSESHRSRESNAGEQKTGGIDGNRRNRREAGRR